MAHHPHADLAPSAALARLPLKALDGSGLVLEVLARSDGLVGAGRVREALRSAAFLHRDQTRASREELPRTPYVEHPLRNTLRLLRWGVTDPDVVVAAVLHDVVEDCAPDIVRHGLGGDPAPLEATELRQLALGWVATTFGPGVGRLVEAVSNPVAGPAPRTDEEKRLAYAAHVRAVVVDDPQVLLVKLADLVDNAAGLHHNLGDWPRERTERMAAKYLPVCGEVAVELARRRAAVAALGPDEEALDAMADALDRAVERLERILSRTVPDP